MYIECRLLQLTNAKVIHTFHQHFMEDLEKKQVVQLHSVILTELKAANDDKIGDVFVGAVFDLVESCCDNACRVICSRCTSHMWYVLCCSSQSHTAQNNFNYSIQTLASLKEKNSKLETFLEVSSSRVVLPEGDNQQEMHCKPRQSTETGSVQFFDHASTAFSIPSSVLMDDIGAETAKISNATSGACKEYTNKLPR